MEIIRTLPQERWTEYRELKRAALTNEPLAFSPGIEAYAEHTDVAWIQELARLSMHPYRIVFAEHEGRLVGMGGLRGLRDPRYRHNVYIQGLYVAPEHRGKGTGTAILETLFGIAKENTRILSMYSEVFSSQSDSIALHEACGFTIVGRLERFLRTEAGEYYDNVLMQKDLRESTRG